VGIGTSPVQQKLEVAGGIQIGDVSTPTDGSIRFHIADFEGYTTSGSWASFTKTKYQSFTGANLISSVRNAEVLSPDSIIIGESGIYFMLFNVDGINGSVYTDLINYDQSSSATVRRVTYGDNISATIPFFQKHTDYNGTATYTSYLSSYTSTSSFVVLSAGDVLKVVSYVYSTGAPTGTWLLFHYSIQLMKMQ
jgi:hypothetical protein